MKWQIKALMAGSCIIIATISALAFTAIASWLGSYSQVDVYIGAMWFFVISLIVSSPLLVPKLRRKYRV